MAKQCGRYGKVMYGSVVVANIKEWSISGFSVETIKKDPAFGDTVIEYCTTGLSEPGTISFNGNFDPADTNGQKALAAVAAAGTALTNLYLYSNTNTFWRVGAGGSILVTKANAVSLGRTGIGTISFEGLVQGANLELCGTGS